MSNNYHVKILDFESSKFHSKTGLVRSRLRDHPPGRRRWGRQGYEHNFGTCTFFKNKKLWKFSHLFTTFCSKPSKSDRFRAFFQNLIDFDNYRKGLKWWVTTRSIWTRRCCKWLLCITDDRPSSLYHFNNPHVQLATTSDICPRHIV